MIVRWPSAGAVASKLVPFKLVTRLPRRSISTLSTSAEYSNPQSRVISSSVTGSRTFRRSLFGMGGGKQSKVDTFEQAEPIPKTPHPLGFQSLYKSDGMDAYYNDFPSGFSMQLVFMSAREGAFDIKLLNRAPQVQFASLKPIHKDPNASRPDQQAANLFDLSSNEQGIVKDLKQLSALNNDADKMLETVGLLSKGKETPLLPAFDRINAQAEREKDTEVGKKATSNNFGRFTPDPKNKERLEAFLRRSLVLSEFTAFKSSPFGNRKLNSDVVYSPQEERKLRDIVKPDSRVHIYTSVITYQNYLFSWKVNQFSDITLQSFSFLRLLTPKPDLIIIGTGQTIPDILPEDLTNMFKSMKINYEVHTTLSAVGLYNILTEEGRTVLGAIMAIPKIDNSVPEISLRLMPSDRFRQKMGYNNFARSEEQKEAQERKQAAHNQIVLDEGAKFEE